MVLERSFRCKGGLTGLAGCTTAPYNPQSSSLSLHEFEGNDRLTPYDLVGSVGLALYQMRSVASPSYVVVAQDRLPLRASLSSSTLDRAGPSRLLSRPSCSLSLGISFREDLTGGHARQWWTTFTSLCLVWRRNQGKAQ